MKLRYPSSRVSKPMRISILVMGLVGIIFGHGCGQFSTNQTSGTETSSSLVLNTGPNDEFVPLQDTKTVGLVYSNQVLDHFLECSGAGQASDSTLAMWEQKKGSISELGGPTQVTAPMLMAITSIAGEVCHDIVEREKTSPRLFVGVNLAQAALPSDNVLGDAVRRLSRSCWQRNETDEERAYLVNQLVTGFQGGDAANSQRAMLFLCTAMLSSLDSLVL